MFMPLSAGAPHRCVGVRQTLAAPDASDQVFGRMAFREGEGCSKRLKLQSVQNHGLVGSRVTVKPMKRVKNG